MNKRKVSEEIRRFLSNMRQDILSENQTPAPETDPEYEIKNFPRLLQLARAGLVPDEMVSKMANVLKDPKRFGVSPQIRDQLYDLMIKTLNYIVISDPAAWARFRSFLMSEETNIEFTNKAIEENAMKNIEHYKNINEEASKILRSVEKVDPMSIQEEICHVASEICEALDDPNRVAALLRSGLVDSGRVTRVRSALKDPEKAMKNPAVRSDLISMLMSLIDIVTNNPSAYAIVKKGAKNINKESESAEEENSPPPASFEDIAKKTEEKYGSNTPLAKSFASAILYKKLKKS